MRRGRALAAAVGLTLLFASGSARAWCRTKACDTQPSYGDVWDAEPDPTECVRNRDGCLLQGTPLRWPSNCLSYGVQKSGSASSGIDYSTARAVIAQAFASWAGISCPARTDGTCDGGPPSFTAFDRGPIACDRPEYNQDQPNANVFLFRDDDWPYSSRSGDGVIALTTITYNIENADIYDADVEFNSREVTFTTGDDEIVADLLAVVTHEIGHFLGLSHSEVPAATMRGIGYEIGTTGLRTIHEDDVAGICEIFPACDAKSRDCSPRHGFSRECSNGGGCALRRPARGTDGAFPTLLALALAVALRRRARRG